MKGATYYAYRIVGPSRPDASNGTRSTPRWCYSIPTRGRCISRRRSIVSLPLVRRHAGRAPSACSGSTWPSDRANGHARRGRGHGGDLRLHVRGFTAPGIGRERASARNLRGGHREDSLSAGVGVTGAGADAVFQFDPSDGDFWGYAPLNFFARTTAISLGKRRITARSVSENGRRAPCRRHRGGPRCGLQTTPARAITPGRPTASRNRPTALFHDFGSADRPYENFRDGNTLIARIERCA